MFSFQNGDGSETDTTGGHYNEAFVCKGVFSEIKLQSAGTKNQPGTESIKLQNGDANHLVNGSPSKHKENCVIHDVCGVLLHHSHPKQPYTLAIAAKQVIEVRG